MTMIRGEIKRKAAISFCQHCQALQKVMGLKQEPCPYLIDKDPAKICASALDAIDAILSIRVDGKYEVTIVDRKAILENPNVRPLIRALDSTPDDHYHAGIYDGYLKCCQDLFGKGWVQEVTE